MIYVVVRPKRYVAAVLQGIEALTEWLKTVSPDVLRGLEIHGQPTFIQYPFMILETEKDRSTFFSPVEKTEGRMELELGLAEFSGFESLAWYTINEDFKGHPDNPGMDYMGALPHTHLNED